MITNSTNLTSAESLEEMQQIAKNQIRLKINELETRINNLQALIPQVENIVDWDSYERTVSDVNYYGDADDLNALSELGNYYQLMKNGGYF